MMAPDYTHWHGTYEIARQWYTKYIPVLKKLAKEAAESGDAAKVEGSKKLLAKIEEIQNTDDHKWSIDKMDSAEAAKRKAARDEFKKRYK